MPVQRSYFIWIYDCGVWTEAAFLLLLLLCHDVDLIQLLIRIYYDDVRNIKFFIERWTGWTIEELFMVQIKCDCVCAACDVWDVY